jgi:hypothetical protein
VFPRHALWILDGISGYSVDVSSGQRRKGFVRIVIAAGRVRVGSGSFGGFGHVVSGCVPVILGNMGKTRRRRLDSKKP